MISQNGAPGAEVNITVRGGTSITQSTTPIYIIDGFQSEDGLKNIDVNDIKTIDILKMLRQQLFMERVDQMVWFLLRPKVEVVARQL